MDGAIGAPIRKSFILLPIEVNPTNGVHATVKYITNDLLQVAGRNLTDHEFSITPYEP